MKCHLLSYRVLLLVPLLLATFQSFATTFQTQSNGNWSSSSTWIGGNVPPTDISGHTIFINHDVSVQNNNIKLMNGAAFYADGITFTMNGGNFIIEDGEALFTNCDVFIAHGWNFQLTTSDAEVAMIGCQVYIGQNFQNSEGERYLEDVCLIVDENYQNDKGTDTLINVCAVIGDSTSGNFQNSSDSWMHIVDSEFHLPNGDFQNQSNATLTGNISAVWLENGNFQNSGNWTAMVSQYCISGQVTIHSTYLPAMMNCTTIASNFNPCSCSGSSYIPMSLQLLVVNVDCHSNTTGSIDLTVNDGESPFSFVWSSGAVTEDLSNISAGTYQVTVTDGTGATATASAIVIEPLPLMVSCTTQQDISCNGSADGALTTTISGGTAPYTFIWSDGQSMQSATGLVAGSYSVTVTDANGCTNDCSITLSEPTALNASCSPFDKVSCYGDSDASAMITASGGAPGYIFNWSTGQTSPIITNIGAGTYRVTVTDIHGCQDSCSLLIEEPDELIVTCRSTQPSQSGLSDGAVSVDVSGGTLAYSYLWSNGVSVSSQSSLAAGVYSVTVTDENGCTATCSSTLTDPIVVVTDTCSIEPGDFRTQTQGGWGSNCAGNNPGCYRDANFAAAFPNGLTVGCTYTVTFTSSTNVASYLPCGGPSLVLTTSYTNPSCLNNTLLSQLITTTLSVTFDQYDASFGNASGLLIDLVLASGPLAGLTVGDVLNEANNAVGGCGSSYSLSDLNQALTLINESFVDGTINTGDLICPPDSNTVQLPSAINRAGRSGTTAWPNPSYGSVNITFKMDRKTDVSIDIFTLNGNTSVRTLPLGYMAAGDHTITWDGSNYHGRRVLGGVYMIRLQTGNRFETLKVIML